MRAILTVFAKEFRENLRERRTLFSALLLGPVLLPLLFYVVLALQIRHNAGALERPLRLSVAHAERAPNLMRALAEAGISVQAVSSDGAAAREAIRTHRETRVLVVSEEFARHLAEGTPAPLVLYADASDVAAAADTERVRATLAQYGALIARLRLVAR